MPITVKERWKAPYAGGGVICHAVFPMASSKNATHAGIKSLPFDFYDIILAHLTAFCKSIKFKYLLKRRHHEMKKIPFAEHIDS